MSLITVPYQLRGGWSARRKIVFLARRWSRGVARIVGLRVNISGKMPSISTGLIVSNHLSYVDIVTYGCIFPLRYSARADMAKWPVLGSFVGLSHPVWIDRNSRQSSKNTARDFAKTVNHGISLVAFPEGTTTDGNSGILPFKSTVFEAAIAANAPITPAVIRYKQSPGEPTICWYGDMTLLPHLWRIMGLSSINAELRFLKPVFPEGQPRKELAGAVRDMMITACQTLP